MIEDKDCSKLFDYMDVPCQRLLAKMMFETLPKNETLVLLECIEILNKQTKTNERKKIREQIKIFEEDKKDITELLYKLMNI